MSEFLHQAAELEGAWLRFLNESSGQHLPVALPIVEKLDRIRSRIVNDMVRVAGLLHELQQPKVAITAGHAQVLVVQDDPRGPETD